MNENNKQEIDLLDLLNNMCCSIKGAAIWLAKTLGNTLRLTYSYKWLFILCMAFGLGWAIYETSGPRTMYRGDLTLRLNCGNLSLYSEQIEQLNKFIKNKDTEGLAEALNINTQQATKIGFIKTYYFVAPNKDSSSSFVDYYQKYDAGDTLNTRQKDKIVISIGLRDRRLYPAMQKVITSYFNQNQYLQSLNNTHRKNLMEQEQAIELDLNRLDSLQRIEFFNKKNSDLYLTDRTTIRSGQRDLYYNDKQQLMRMKKLMETDLSTGDGVVSIISPFHPTAKAYVGICKALPCRLAEVYLMFVLLALLLKYRKQIINYLKGIKIEQQN